jgi:hypothetical protein
MRKLRPGSFDLVFRRQGKIGLLLGLLVFLFSLLDRLFGIGCAGLGKVMSFFRRNRRLVKTRGASEKGTQEKKHKKRYGQF